MHEGSAQRRSSPGRRRGEKPAVLKRACVLKCTARSPKFVRVRQAPDAKFVTPALAET